MDLAGRDVTSHLQNLLRKSGINLNTSAEFELVRTIKEKYCSISLTPLEKAREKKEKYTLPDGQQVEFSNNEKEAGEIMFAPDKIGLESPCTIPFIQRLFSSCKTVWRKSTSTSE
jgi:centractin